VSLVEGSYLKWLSAYGQAWQNPSIVKKLPCPSCGAKSLRLLFLVNEIADAVGIRVFWCESCMRGLIPLRASVPETGSRLLKNAAVIPNFRLVVDDSED
jgi:hypothetical protein